MKSFAQNFEDVMLWRALGQLSDGFFIDIGAHHPVKDSVSKIFSEAGWTGIHVEPVPFYADLLRKDRPREKVIEAVVSDTNGLCEFYSIEGTGLSTSRKDIADNHKANNFEYSAIIVSAVTLDDILSLCPDREIHWLKIDVEGMEKAVLSGWLDASRRPWVVVIESTFPGTQKSNFQDWEEIILRKGYRHVYSDGLNRFYLHDDHSELDVHFQAPPNIFDGFQLTPESDHVIEIIRAHAQNITAMESHFAAHEQELQLRADQIIASVRSEAREQLNAALNREQALIRAGIVQQQEWEQRCATLKEQIESVRENFLAREKAFQSRTDAIVSDVHAKAREQLEAAREHERALSQAVATQQEQYGSAIATLTQSYQSCLDQMKKQISDRTGDYEDRILKEINNSGDQKRIIENLLLIIEGQRDALEGVYHSRIWKLLAPFRVILKETILDKKIIDVEEDARPSHIWALMKHSNMAHASVGESDGPEGSMQLEICPGTEKSRDNENFTHQGCTTDMSSQDINNIIDLMSLPLDQFITTSYNLLLERKPEPSELRLHMSALRSGLGRRKIIFEIYSSPEYKIRVDEIINVKSDDEFIRWLYHRYMHRSPDSAGLSHYSSMLGRGVSRERVKKDIVNSSEARSTGGLWIELDRLLEVERQQHKRSRRWFRRQRSSDRLERQEQEALLQLFHTADGRHPNIWHSEHRQAGQADDAGTPSNLMSNAVRPSFPLASVDTSDMGPEARRIIQRLQHVKGASSLEKGHA